MTDWLAEAATSNPLSGFTWKNGPWPETMGIWMWSDVFKYDFPNGDKIAIILFDTQGIRDDRNPLHDYIMTFALSMMSSSILCYNLMLNIREPDLQHLEPFTEYGRFTLEHTNEKAFQKLLFIVRDWPNSTKSPYENGQRFINDPLSENDDQTFEMRELRKRITMSFKTINAFLMPHPGFIALYDQNFSGNLQEIAPNFIENLKQLVPLIFAPENLVVKKIYGKKIRTRDFTHYFQAYSSMFNGSTLPEPRKIMLVCTILCYCIWKYYWFSRSRLIEHLFFFVSFG